MEHQKEQQSATHLLRDDHKRIKGLLSQMEAVDQRAAEMKSGIAREIIMELEIHSKLEEEIFYPAVRERADERCNALIEKSYADHQQISDLLGQLKNRDTEHEEFNVAFQDLEEAVELHVEEEERLLLPAAESLLNERLGEVARRMAIRREELLKLPDYQFSKPETVQDPRGGEQMRKRPKRPGEAA